MKLRLKRWERRLSFTKRQIFVGVVLLLTTCLILTQLVSTETRYPLVFMLAVLTYILSAFALREDLNGIEWFTLLMLPTLYSTAVSLFYFLLPTRWLTRIPVAGLYAIGLYALILTENIYNVAGNRTIALLRAARSIGFFITFVTYYLLVLTVFSFRFSFVFNTAVIGLVSVLVVFPSLWSIELTTGLSRKVRVIGSMITLMLIELAWVLSFWPAPTAILAVVIATSFYTVVGMAQEYLVDRLYKKTVMEFGIVWLITILLLFFVTRWRPGI